MDSTAQHGTAWDGTAQHSAAAHLNAESCLGGSAHDSLLDGPPCQLVPLPQGLPINIFCYWGLLWNGGPPQLCPAPSPRHYWYVNTVTTITAEFLNYTVNIIDVAAATATATATIINKCWWGLGPS